MKDGMSCSCNSSTGSLRLLQVILTLFLLASIPTVPSACALQLNLNTTSTVRMCYLYIGAITDLGWTFSYNVGRLEVHDYLSTTFPNVTFRTTATENVGAMNASVRHAAIVAYAASGCHIILTNSAVLMNFEDNFFAAAYPNVSWVLHNASRVLDATFANRVYYGAEFMGGYYVAGAMAGTQATTCIGFTAAFSNSLNPTSAWAGFLRGVRSTNPTIPVHVQALQNWDDPVGDVLLATAYTSTLGCEVTGRYSDPYAADRYISSLGRTDVFSIGSHSNLDLYVGDSVLTSVYVHWTTMLLQVLLPLMHTGDFNRSQVQFYGVEVGAVSVAGPSPRANMQTVAAYATAYEYVMNRSGRVVCGATRLAKGGLAAMNATTGCRVPWDNINDLVIDDYTIVHAAYVNNMRCNAGTYYTYDALVARTLVCVPCAAGTFSSAAGQAACQACAPGSDSYPGATKCFILKEEGFQAATAVAIALGALVLLLVCGALALFIVYIRRRNEAAPRKPPLCLIFIGIEAEFAIAKICSGEISDARDTFRSVVSSVAARNGVYETPPSSSTLVSPTSMRSLVIACPDVVDAVSVAVEILETMAIASWPPMIRDLGGLKPRIAVQLCTAVDVSLQLRTLRYVYSGDDVDVGHCLAELAPSGNILADRSTVDALTEHPEFQLVLAYEITMRHYRDVVESRSFVRLSSAEFPAQSSEVDLQRERATMRLDCTELLAIQKKSSNPFVGSPKALRTTSEAVLHSRSPTASSAPHIHNADPDLNRSYHSSYESSNSLTLVRGEVDMGTPQLAVALYAMLSAAERRAPRRKKELLLLLSDIFGLQSRVLTGRRIAAALAFRLLQPAETDAGVLNGITTATSSSAFIAEDPPAAMSPASPSNHRDDACSPVEAATNPLQPPHNLGFELTQHSHEEVF